MARRGDALYLRGKTWYLDFRHDGTRHAVRLGKNISRSVAGELAHVKRAAILKGEAGIGRKRKDLEFDEAAKLFLAWAEANKRPKTVRTYQQCIEHLTCSFRGKRLSEITTWLIEKHKQSRKDAGAPVRANREVACLKTLFNRCKEWKLYEGENPVRGVKFLEEPQGRLRYLEPEEEARLLEAAREPLRTLIILGIYTGLRIQAEALTLRWEDVDLRRGQLTVLAAYAKGKATRTVPLCKPLTDALKRLQASAKGEKEESVIAKPDGTPYSSIRSAFEAACEKAKLENVTPHTLRHTFASRLMMDGVDVRTIQELGGWRVLKMVERYSHVSAAHKAEAVERMAAGFHNVVHNTEKVALATCS
ncbi:site-specific integrase [Nitrospiraceae bacterium AH_259_D15_M11_P09]|nr:site-specific integrase [Nitrospiraceae bacterium AH_259_D15_M11_P09]